MRTTIYNCETRSADSTRDRSDHVRRTTIVGTI